MMGYLLLYNKCHCFAPRVSIDESRAKQSCVPATFKEKIIPTVLCVSSTILDVCGTRSAPNTGEGNLWYHGIVVFLAV